MEVALILIGLAVLCGIMANKRGRNGFGYFMLALIISPLLCALLLFALGKADGEATVAPGGETPETHVKCPDCRELVLKEALVCKHCGCKLVPQ
jgi:hypothetical protein